MGLLSGRSLDREVLSVAVHLAASLVLITPHTPHAHTLLTQLVKAVTGVRVVETWEVSSIIEFFQELAENYPEFAKDILNECLAFCNSVIKNVQHQDLILKFLAELCVHFNPLRVTIEDSSKKSITDFLLYLDQPLINKGSIVNCPIVSCVMIIVSSWEDCLKEVESGGCGQLWAALTVLKYIR